MCPRGERCVQRGNVSERGEVPKGLDESERGDVCLREERCNRVRKGVSERGEFLCSWLGSNMSSLPHTQY